MNFPSTRVAWWVHVALAVLISAIAIGLWSLVPNPLSRGLSRTDWLLLLGYHLEASGLYLTLADIRYTRRGFETPLAIFAVILFLLGAQLALAGSLMS